MVLSLSLGWAAIYASRSFLYPLFPIIAAHLGISSTQAGSLSGFYFILYVAFQIPAGLLMDRIGTKRCLIAGCLLSGLALFGIGFLGNSYGMLLFFLGVQGIGEPGGACAICPLNAWGSGDNGRGKACKNMRHLFLLRDGAFMPLQIILPPTSIRPFNDFVSMIFAARRRGTCGSIIQIGLKRMNNGKDDYSVATFKKLYDFTGEQLAQMKMFADGFKSQIKAALLQRAADAEGRPDSMIEIEDGGYTPDYGNNDSRFSVSSYAGIDGDRDALPA